MSYVPNSTGEEQWNDFMTAVLALPTGNTVPTLIPFTPVTGLSLLGFIGTGTRVNEIFATIEVLHEYKEDSDFHLHLHWSPSTNNVGNIKWYADFSVTNTGSTFQNQVTTSVVVPSGGTPWIHTLSEFNNVISGLGIKVGAMICVRIWRDPADVLDTFTGYAVLHAVGVHTLMDTLGSRQETIK